MDPDPVTLALELTHRSPAEREARYAQLRISTALRAEVEALLLADAEMGDTLAGRLSGTREHLTRHENLTPNLTPSDSRAARIPTESPALQAIGRYEIVRLLGRGGNGDVYLAHDPVLDRDVAVKLIRGDFDDSVAHTRLVLEARAAGRLRHPNIVTIFDVGEHEGNPYIAMEHVPGETLRSIIRRQAELSLPRRLELVEGASAGLAHAHRAGVVHLDVKPDNLMLDDGGIVKVLDFGIARVVRSETLVTNHNVGTLRYMSPEQVSGAPLDRRSDVFSLGASCFELVAYAPAYAGSTHEMITRIAEGPVPRLLEVVPEVDPRLDEILGRAMALDPMDRFEDLDDFRLELARLRLDMDPGTGVHLRSRVVPFGGVRAPSSARSRVQSKPGVSRWRPGVVAGLGVASIVVIGLGAFCAIGPGPAASPEVANANAAAANVPPAATGTLPGAQSASPPAASNGGDDVWRRLAIGDRAAVLQVLRGGTTGDGPAANPRLASAVVDAVRASVSRAREAASATSASRSSEVYRRAEERFARANRLQADQQPLDALGALWQAADYYARVTTPSEPPPLQAASGAGVLVSKPGSTPAPPASTGPGSDASTGASTGGPSGNASRAAASLPPVLVNPPVAPATPPVAEAASAAPATNVAGSAAIMPSDTEAIVAALRRYHEAYKALDVSGVLQVFPTLASNQVAQLRRTFAEMSAYEIEARQTRVDVRSDVATVRAVVARRMVPRVGRPLANEVETEFRLRREGRGWLITEVRAVTGQ